MTTTRATSGRPLFALLVAIATLAIACTSPPADAGRGRLKSGTTIVDAPEGSSDVATASGLVEGETAAAPTTTVPSSGDAAATREALDSFIDGITGVPSDTSDFLENVSDNRLDELSTTACDGFGAEVSITELASAVVALHGALDDAERELLDLNELRVGMGILVAFHCPDRLPEEGSLLEVEFALGDLVSYRLNLSSLLGDVHPATSFIESLSDQRLDELKRSACSVEVADRSLAEFGLIAVEHHGDALSSAEKDQIGRGHYVELFGSLLGWFCPERFTPESN